MKRKKSIAIIAGAVIVIAALVFWPPEMIKARPSYARDSDGNPSGDITERISSNGLEDVNLKVSGFAFVQVDGWNFTHPLVRPERVFVNVLWKTDVSRGAGNIYVGYSIDGETFSELGPFNESSDIQNTTLEIAGPYQYDVGGIKVRWRGNDTDYKTAARGYVSFEMTVYDKIL
jgi:hypothetical protein